MDELTLRNIKAIQAYAEETRKQFRAMELANENYTNKIETLMQELAVMRTQMQALQIKVYSGAATA